ncbi:unnamed protein product [Rotaria magnacalcarata]|uniref:Dienelactone hydrolase domain-containing protein n=1 Tax=Rotaria magnacalcarata TaxID=392030 RepID=A0A814G9G2_9BILA|nr:unnamed protein product [Rotaria magnacalcarata]
MMSIWMFCRRYFFDYEQYDNDEELNIREASYGTLVRRCIRILIIEIQLGFIYLIAALVSIYTLNIGRITRIRMKRWIIEGFCAPVKIYIFCLQNANLLYRTCNINILLFDYRGYGKSTGAPSEAGLYTDALAVYNYVRKRNDLDQNKIFLFGRSLGGAVALNLASQLSQTNATPPLYAVIVENTFTSIPDMAKRLFQVSVLDYVPNWCYKNVYPSLSKMRSIKVPILFLSGGQDELVPSQMMEKLHEECKSSKKQLAVFPDGQHNTTWLSHDYTSRIRKFLAECSTSMPTESSTSTDLI